MKDNPPLDFASKICLTAFFYSEYVYRHLEELYQWPTKFARIFKDFLKNNYPEINADELLDCLIELEAFHCSEKYGCNIFSGAIIKRIGRRKGTSESVTFFSEAENVRDSILTYKSIYRILKLITKLSLRYGVYVSHIDIYRKYSFENLSKLDKDSMLQHIFYKTEKKMQFRTSYFEFEENIYHPSRTDIKKASHQAYTSRDQHMKFYIDIEHEDFSFEETIQKVSNILLSSKYDDLLNSIDDYKKHEIFFETFFLKSIYRSNQDEARGKLIGILIWDIKKRKKTSIRATLFEISRDYNIKINSDCKREKCNKDCYRISNGADVESCVRQADRLYKVACNSIREGKITTSVGLK